MKNILHNLLSRKLVTAANDGELSIANAVDGSGVFEIRQGDSFFVPYGEYPHAKGLQKFDQASAEIMRAAANSMLGRAAGIPVYRGHPDVPGRPDTDPAAPALGWIQDIIVENDGARFIHKLGKAGQVAVENAEYRFYSPHWLLQPVKGGIQPIRMLSMGLTNNPRIPVPAIANDENTDTQETKPMPDWLINLIKLALPVTVANDKGDNLIDWLKAELVKDTSEIDPQVKDAIDWLLRSKERADALEQAKQDAAANDKSGEVTRLEGELTDVKGQLTTANDRTKTVRGLLITRSLTRAVEAGKLTAADRTPRETELLAIENDGDLVAKLTEIENAQGAIKTSSGLGDLSGARKTLSASNDAQRRSELRQAAVEKAMLTISNDLTPASRYDAAWRIAQKANPELFTNQPTTV